MNSQTLPHTTVLLKESVDSLDLRAGDIAIDCTVGGGGHTEAILDRVGPTGLVIGLDRDASALELAHARLRTAIESGRLRLIQARFAEIGDIAEKHGVTGKVQGILADIGVSSMHLNQAERGFSFQNDGPLDMRMDPSKGESAADIVNNSSQEELSKIFWEFGEEPQSRQVARRIIESRAISPITSTAQLADIVKRSLRYTEKSKKHPATKVFQALRIATNNELGELESLLNHGLNVLRPNGRFAIITFHSLEDRLVKTKFQEWTGQKDREKIPRNLPLSSEQIAKMTHAKGSLVKPFPLTPTDQEISSNPRARSAKLRVINKLS